MSYINFMAVTLLSYLAYSLVLLVIFWRKCERVGAKKEVSGFLMVAIMYPLFFSQIVLIYGQYVDRISGLLLILGPAAVWLAVAALTKDPTFQAIHDVALDEAKRNAYRKSRERNFAVYFLSLAVMVLCVAANMSQTVPRNAPVETITGRVHVYVLFDNRLFSIKPDDNSAKQEEFYCGRGRATVCRPDANGNYPENEVWTVTYVTNPAEYKRYAITVEADDKVLRTAKEGWTLYSRSMMYDFIAVFMALVAVISLSTYFRRQK